MTLYKDLMLRLMEPESWNKILDYCAKYDVEEGEGEEYQYSVRKSTGTLTIWTRRGWIEGYYIARITTEKRRDKIKLVMGTGTAPAAYQWPKEKVESHIKELHSRLCSEESPL